MEGTEEPSRDLEASILLDELETIIRSMVTASLCDPLNFFVKFQNDLGSVYEKIARFTGPPFPIDYLCEKIKTVSMQAYFVPLHLSLDEDVRNSLARLKSDNFCRVVERALLLYFTNKCMEQNRLLAVPAGDTSNAVAEIMDSLHTP